MNPNKLCEISLRNSWKFFLLPCLEKLESDGKIKYTYNLSESV